MTFQGPKTSANGDSTDHRSANCFTLTAILENSFTRFPTQEAIDSGDLKVTYQQLEKITREIALSLTARYSRDQLKTQPIAILMSRSIELYLAQVAVIRAGGFFVALDHKQPQQRIDWLLKDSRAMLVLARPDDRLAPLGLDWLNLAAGELLKQYPPGYGHAQSVSGTRCAAEQFTAVPPGSDLDQPTLAVAPDDQLPTVSKDDLAYLVYTSGSTGTPKGVAISHASICNHNQWCIKAYQKTATDRCLQFTSPGFDVCIEEVFSTFAAGSCLVPLEPQAVQTPTGFHQWTQQRRLTVLTLPVSFWEILVLAAQPDHRCVWADSLRLVVFGGEQVNSDIVSRWFASVESRIDLVNAYGPSETTITASFARLKKGAPVTIGQPIDGLEFFVVDENDRIVDVKSTGELIIGGIGVANGYWHHPRLTKQRFATFSFHCGGPCYRTGDKVRRRIDGDFEFLGRLDDQVKVRGFRIEPAEVARTMESCPGVEKAFVKACNRSEDCDRPDRPGEDDRTGDTHLVGYYISNDARATCQPEDLRAWVSQKLPEWMVPTQFVLLQTFPLTERGKIDQQQLPPAFPIPRRSADGPAHAKEKTIPEHLTLETELQRRLAKIWSSVLGSNITSPDDNFFVMGGDSLRAMKMVLMLEREFSLRVPVATLIPHPTIGELTQFIQRQLANASANANSNAPDGDPIASPAGAPTITPIGNSRNPSGSNSDVPLLVFIHAAGGGAMFYSDLYQTLTHQPPAIVLESPYLHGSGLVKCDENDLQEIARVYADAIVTESKSSRIILAGYSLGGLLAHEMAILLVERGISIDKVINIDAPNPQTIREQPLWARALRNVLKLKNPPAYLREISKTRSRSEASRQIIERQSVGQGPPEAHRSLALEMAYRCLIEKFQPKYFDGTMRLIRSTQETARVAVPADYGWSGHVRNLHVDKIPGGHLTIFSQPGLDHLKTAFRRAVEA